MPRAERQTVLASSLRRAATWLSVVPLAALAIVAASDAGIHFGLVRRSAANDIARMLSFASLGLLSLMLVVVAAAPRFIRTSTKRLDYAYLRAWDLVLAGALLIGATQGLLGLVVIWLIGRGGIVVFAVEIAYGVLFLGFAWMFVSILFFGPAEEAAPSLVFGEPLGRGEGRELHDHVDDIAERVGVPAPARIIVGGEETILGASGFVSLNGTTPVAARDLYIGVPLLEVLSVDELRALFAYELASFRPGFDTDTDRSIPLLSRVTFLSTSLTESRVARPIAELLLACIPLFGAAIRENARRRGLASSRTASVIVSPEAFASARAKLMSYHAYVARAEGRHVDRLPPTYVGVEAPFPTTASGWREYVASDDADCPTDVEDPRTGLTLRDHLDALGVTCDRDSLLARVRSRPDAMMTTRADRARIIDAHLSRRRARCDEIADLVRATTLTPTTDEERRLVEIYFPARTFDSKKDSLRVDFSGVHLSTWPAPIRFDALATVTRKAGAPLSLELVVNEVGAERPRKVALDLDEFGEPFDARDCIEAYFDRHRQARAAQVEAFTSPRPPTD